MIRKAVYVTLIFIIGFVFKTFAQGCSDAGFCSAGTLKPGAESDSVISSHAGIKFIYGSGEEGVSNIQIVPEIDWNIAPQVKLQAAIPYIFNSGNLGSTNGVGDLLISINCKILESENTQLNLTVGGKFPTGKTDEIYSSGISLPMPYQTGLGTYDIIIGGGLTFKKWIAAIGYQGVLKNDNKNNFYKTLLYPDPETSGYFDSRLLDRGDDALIRVGYGLNAGKAKIVPGLLAIYRLQQDVITYPNGTDVALEGSDGLTLNITGSASLPVGNDFSLYLEAGAPVIVRDVRADGLTRSFVAGAAIRYMF